MRQHNCSAGKRPVKVDRHVSYINNLNISVRQYYREAVLPAFLIMSTPRRKEAQQEGEDRNEGNNSKKH